MNGKKYVPMGWAILVATVLWASPVWASEQDTGYPWFGDISENNKTVIPPSQVFHVAPVMPSEEDTGYPWFADTKEDQTIKKPVTIFKAHPRTVEEDTGYPWHADTKDDGQNISKHKTTAQ